MGRGAGVRLGVVAAIGLGLLAAAPGSAWAACSTVKEVTVDAVFQGKKCVSSGKLTLQGVSYEPDTGETLTGSISQVSREGRVTVGKQGNLIGPLFIESCISNGTS